MPEKKILIICRHLIPYSESLGWSLRVVRLARFLSARGWDVHLLGAKENELFGYFGYEQALEGIECLYLPHFHNFLKGKDVGAASLKKKDHLRPLKRFFEYIFDEISTPDLFVWFTPKFYKEAKRLIEEKKISRVVISSPPHSLLLAGMMLKRKFGDRIKVVADYRDSWNYRGVFKKNLPLLRDLNQYLERKVLESMDRITYVSAPILGKIVNAYGEKFSAKGTLVMNGYDRESVDDAADRARCNVSGDSIRIGYYGSIKGKGLDPLPFARLLAEVRKSLESDKRDVRLEFYSPREVYKEREIESILSGRVVFHGVVDHREALESMRTMDYLLLLYSEPEGADEVITGKFFDYVASRTPIISFGPHDMEAHRLIRDKKLGLALNMEDEEKARKSLIELFRSQGLKTHVLTTADIAEFDIENQFLKFDEILSG